MNPLDKHLTDSDLTEAAFAQLSDIERSLINRYRRGEVRPSMAKARRIELASGGSVPALSWYPELTGAA